MRKHLLKPKTYNLQPTRGASLMETVVYVALVALLSIMVVQSIVSLSNSFKAIRAVRDIENSALTSLDRISREVRTADALGVGGVFGTTTSKLVLAYSGVATTTREFSVFSDRTLHLFENSVDSGPLTSENVTVTSFKVELATTSTKTLVRVTLILTDKRAPANQKSATFYTAAAMRNLY